MNHLASLKAWMHSHGYTNKGLAEKLGYSYELIYAVMSEVRPITNNFRWRFAQVFGWEEAVRVFEPSATTEAAPETEPNPEPELA